MKRIILASALVAALVAAPASAAVNSSVPFCKKNPAACEAICIIEPWRLFCRA
jgi:hypothetical protein